MTAKTHGAFGSIPRWTAPRWAMVGLTAAALLALAACDGPPAPETSTPQPTPDQAAAPSSTPLLGGPPAPADQGAETPAAPFDFHPMQPVPNPEDLSGDERVKIYGHRYDHLGAGHHEGHHHHHHAGRVHGQAGGTAPAAHAQASHHHAHPAPAPAAPHAVKPHAARQAPAPKPAPAAPKLAPAPTPAPKPAPAAPATPAKPASSAAQPAVSSAEQDQGGGPAASGASSAQAGSAAANQAPNRLNADWLSIPGAPTVDVPGFGKVASKTLVAIGLLLLALVILALAIRGVPAKKPAAKPNAYRPTELGGDDPPKT